MALDKIVALLGFGCPIAPAPLLCRSIGTAFRSLSSSELRPSRYLRSTWLCGWRLEDWLFDVGDAAVGWLSVALRSIFGRPRFLVGRLGVEDSEADAGDDGDSRFSMWGLREGETA